MGSKLVALKMKLQLSNREYFGNNHNKKTDTSLWLDGSG